MLLSTLITTPVRKSDSGIQNNIVAFETSFGFRFFEQGLNIS